MSRRRSSTGSDLRSRLGHRNTNAHTDAATPTSKHFLLRAPTRCGWLDEQAGGRPRVRSTEEDFFQVGHLQPSLFFCTYVKHQQVQDMAMKQNTIIHEEGEVLQGKLE